MVTATWISSTAKNWSDTTAWDTGVKPATGDDVVFNGVGGADGNCSVNEATAALTSFTVTTEYTGTITCANAIKAKTWSVDFGGSGGFAGTATSRCGDLSANVNFKCVEAYPGAMVFQGGGGSGTTQTAAFQANLSNESLTLNVNAAGNRIEVDLNGYNWTNTITTFAGVIGNAGGHARILVKNGILTITHNTSIGDGPNYNCTGEYEISVTTGTISLGPNGQFTAGRTTGSNTTIIGSNTAYTLDVNNNLFILLSAELRLPTAAGTCTISGTTIDINGTLTHNSGKITFDKSGTTTLQADGKTFYDFSISAATTLSVTEAITMAAGGSIELAAAGTLTPASGIGITFA